MPIQFMTKQGGETSRGEAEKGQQKAVVSTNFSTESKEGLSLSSHY